jgi:hypothetical protein
MSICVVVADSRKNTGQRAIVSNIGENCSLTRIIFGWAIQRTASFTAHGEPGPPVGFVKGGLQEAIV